MDSKIKNPFAKSGIKETYSIEVIRRGGIDGQTATNYIKTSLNRLPKTGCHPFILSGGIKIKRISKEHIW